MKRETSIIVLMLARDLFFILVAGFSAILVAESLLPTFIGGHVSLAIIGLIVFGGALLLKTISDRLEIDFFSLFINRTWLRIAGYVFLAVLVVNALRKFSWSFIAFSLVLFLAIAFLLEKDFDTDQPNDPAL